jgi:hypothetical protein
MSDWINKKYFFPANLWPNPIKNVILTLEHHDTLPIVSFVYDADLQCTKRCGPTGKRDHYPLTATNHWRALGEHPRPWSRAACSSHGTRSRETPAAASQAGKQQEEFREADLIWSPPFLHGHEHDHQRHVITIKKATK